MSYQRMPQGYLRLSELTLYASSTTRSGLQSVSAGRARLRLKLPSQASVSTWISGSCVHQLLTTQGPHLPLTGWSPLSTVSTAISWSWISSPGTCGYFSVSPRSLLLMKCQHSCPHLASKRAVLYDVIKAASWLAARNSSRPCSSTTTTKWSLQGQTHRHKMVESSDLIKLLESS